MNIRRAVSLVLTFLVAATVPAGLAQGTAFIYNGQLKQQGQSPNGERDLRFGLFANATNGTAIATINRPNVPLNKGTFSVTLDFGQAFDGNPRWLEISVKNNKGQFVTLKPRQRFMPTPYAIMAGSASNLLGTLPASQLTGTLPPGAFGGTYSSPLILNNAANSFTGNGAGLNNVNATKLGGLEAGNLWQLGGNAGTKATNFLGTKDFQSLELKANGLRALRIEPQTNASPNVVAGAQANVVGTFNANTGKVYPYGVYGATISGGGGTNASESNVIASHFGTIGGGSGNYIEPRDPNATISGGIGNVVRNIATPESSQNSVISGGSSNILSTPGSVVGGGMENLIFNGNVPGGVGETIGGGLKNEINSGLTSGGSTIGGGKNNRIFAHYGTIAGGSSNEVRSMGARMTGGTVGGGVANRVLMTKGLELPGRFPIFGYAVVAGGYQNTAGGAFSTIPGGASNSASGNFSFAAGNHANAEHDGSFVWADGNGFEFPSLGENTFSVRSVGGARFVSAIDAAGNPSAGVELPAGGGAWATLSDRDAKENLSAVNPRDVLERVAQMPISTWNYKSQDNSIRHIGPMAQDFAAAFQVGEDTRRITTVDADGVALAAIQGLNQVVKEKDAEIQELKQRLEKLEKLMQKSGGEK